jgi:hypothetical protein
VDASTIHARALRQGSNRPESRGCTAPWELELFAYPLRKHVLDAFQKKSPSGIRTAKRDVDLVEQRLRQAQRDYEEHYGETTR